MRKKSILRAFFISLPILAATCALTLAWAGGNQSQIGIDRIAKRADSGSYDFSSAKEADGLSVKIVSSSGSSMGQFLELSFTTGGICFGDANNNYRIAPSDPEFSDYYENVFKALSDEEKDEIAEKAANGEYEAPIFDGYVQSATLQSPNGVFVVPKCLYRNEFWGIRPTAIYDVLYENWSAKPVSEIYIPNTVEHVSEKAFRGVDPSKIKFFLESDSIPAEWEEGWNHDCPVEVGFDYNAEFRFDRGPRAASKSLPLMSAGTYQFGDDDENFYIGYYNADQYYPLVAQYHLKGEEETDAYHFYEFDKKAENLEFDAVGGGITGYTTNLFCDIPLQPGEEIDVESIRLQNILPCVNKDTEVFSGDGAKKEFTLKVEPAGIIEVLVNDAVLEATAYTLNGNKVVFTEAPAAGTDNVSITYRIPWTPVVDQLLYTDPAISYSHSYSLEEFVKTEFVGFSTFGEFTMVRTKMSLGNLREMYSIQKASTYNNYKDQLDSGALYVRARLTSISTSSLEFIYEDGGTEKSVETVLSSPVAQVILKNQENSISFLVRNSELGENFSTAKIRQVNLLNLYVTLDLFASNGTVARSNVSTRFGIVAVMPHQNQAPANFDLVLFLVLEALIFVVLFAAGTVGLFLYRKAKYKNDEFLRVNPKKFFIRAAIALVCSYIVLLAVSAIVLRTGLFANAVVVYNPLDAFIIIFGILSILVIGYFGKYLVGAIKARNERNRVRRLKLDEDVPDDGTNI